MPAQEAEIRMLYDRYAHVLHHRARHILGTDAEADDAVQETFARVIRHHDAFRQEASPLTWMYRICTHWCLNRLRDQRGHRRIEDQHLPELAPGIAEPDLSALDHGRLRDLIAGADDQTRAILLHHYFDGCTREETAALVGLSLPTLRKRLDEFHRRARRALLAALGSLWVRR